MDSGSQNAHENMRNVSAFLSANHDLDVATFEFVGSRCGVFARVFVDFPFEVITGVIREMTYAPFDVLEVGFSFEEYFLVGQYAYFTIFAWRDREFV